MHRLLGDPRHDISSFDVRVLDVAAGEATSGGGRILFEVSGPAVDATGIGPGFSGSPIYCADDAGVSRVIGAVSESINEYGGKVALATPIEAIIGTPVDVPGRPSAAAPTPRADGRGERARLSPRMRAALASARPLASPLTVSGVTGPVAQALAAAGAKAGRPILAVPPGPLGSFPVQTLRPGSAVAVGFSNGDVRASSVGTVAYVDGDRVWVFGHRSRAPGGARCCCRTRTCSGSSTTRSSSARSAPRTSSRLRATTSARSARTGSAPSPGAPARSRTRSRCR